MNNCLHRVYQGVDRFAEARSLTHIFFLPSDTPIWDCVNDDAYNPALQYVSSFTFTVPIPLPTVSWDTQPSPIPLKDLSFISSRSFGGTWISSDDSSFPTGTSAQSVLGSEGPDLHINQAAFLRGRRFGSSMPVVLDDEPAYQSRAATSVPEEVHSRAVENQLKSVEKGKQHIREQMRRLRSTRK